MTLPAGDNSGLTPQASTTYWFAPGTHTIGTGTYGQILAADNDVFVGAPGAIISGQNANQLAFTGTGSPVTIEYLTIENFVPASGQGAVNASLARNWTVQHDTIQDIGNVAESGDGAGAMLGSGNIYEDDCLTNDGTAGVQTAGSIVKNILVTDNEISRDGIALFPKDNCGCAAGMKTFNTTGATFTNNYVHDNYGAGLWIDTDNAGWDVEGNYFAGTITRP